MCHHSQSKTKQNKMKNLLFFALFILATFQANAQFNNKLSFQVGAGNGTPPYGLSFQHIFLSDDYTLRPLFGLATYPPFGNSTWKPIQYYVGAVVQTENDFFVRGKIGNVWELDGGKVVGRFAISGGIQNMQGWKTPSNFNYTASVTYLINSWYENARNCYDNGWGQALSITLGANADKELKNYGLMLKLNFMFGE